MYYLYIITEGGGEREEREERERKEGCWWVVLGGRDKDDPSCSLGERRGVMVGDGPGASKQTPRAHFGSGGV